MLSQNLNNMKQLLAPILATTIAAMLCCSCEEPAGPIETTVYTYEGSTAHASMQLSAELPSGTDRVAKAIREDLMDVIDEQLGHIVSYEGERQFDAFTGDRSDTEAYVKYYFDKSLEILARDSDGDARDREEYMKEDHMDEAEMAEILSGMPSWEYEFNLSKIEDADRYCVFQSQDYVYMGGAHGGVTGAGCITYDKRNGSRFTDFFEPQSELDLQPLMRECLAEYFTTEDYPVTADNLKEYLLIEGEYIPLPVWPPYPAADGLVFTYQQYEIAPYAAGMPSFTLSFDALESCLTAESKQLLGL
jgi:hypothetical protein